MVGDKHVKLTVGVGAVAAVDRNGVERPHGRCQQWDAEQVLGSHESDIGVGQQEDRNVHRTRMVRDHHGTIGLIRERVAMHYDTDTAERRAYGDGPSCNSPTPSPVDALSDHDCR